MRPFLLCILALVATLRADEIRLRWDPPPETNGLAFYTVYLGTNSRSYVASVPAVAPLAVVSNLNRGNCYFFVVTATYTNGTETQPSAEIRSWIVSPVLPRPSRLSIVGTNQFSVERSANLLSWQTILSAQPTTNAADFFRIKWEVR